jgi:hypothetical protein
MLFIENLNARTLPALDFFLAVREVMVFNKLAGRTDYWGRDLSMWASGDQLMARMSPERGGFASYFLREFDDAVILLRDVGVLHQRKRSEGPSGYGDDEEFTLTFTGLQLCEGKDREEIRQAVAESINSQLFEALDWIDLESDSV